MKSSQHVILNITMDWGFSMLNRSILTATLERYYHCPLYKRGNRGPERVQSSHKNRASKAGPGPVVLLMPDPSASPLPFPATGRLQAPLVTWGGREFPAPPGGLAGPALQEGQAPAGVASLPKPL